MNFVKTLEIRRSGRYSGEGSVVIADGVIAVRIPTNKFSFKNIGIIKDGIGVELEKSSKKRTAPNIFTTRHFESDDIPIELQGEKHRFRIPGEKISDTEYVFMFKKAKMLNTK